MIHTLLTLLVIPDGSLLIIVSYFGVIDTVFFVTVIKIFLYAKQWWLVGGRSEVCWNTCHLCDSVRLVLELGV